MSEARTHSAAPALDDGGAWAVDVGGIHVVFGDGAIDGLGDAARALGARRALLVTDRGLERAGHAQHGRDALRRAGLEVEIFDGVEENPTTRHVAAGVEAARAFTPDLIVAVGGGSSLDCAKGINFLYTNGGRMEDYWGDGKAARPMLPSIGVPTTAGTGSEAQRFALVSRDDDHRKMACGDKKARFKTVILDPRLISSMPHEVAAVSGMDAITHAVESFVTRRRNPISQLYAREAWRLLESSFESFLTDPEAPRSRARMLLGAHLAGAAIEASMLGAAHSCANPLTAHFDVTHGIAVGLMLPHVIRFNGPQVGELYGDLLDAAGLNGDGTPPERLSLRVAELGRAAGIPERLADCGVDPAKLALLAGEAAEQWTASFNPRRVAADDLRALYESAF